MTATANPTTIRTDVLVIGGGQAGLAAGYHLQRQGIDYRIVEADARIGDVWRRRYDSLKLYSPAGYDALAGAAFPLPKRVVPDRPPDGRLPRVVRRPTFGLRVGHERAGSSGWSGPLPKASRSSHSPAIGATRRARSSSRPARSSGRVVPAFAAELDPGICQLHSSEYRNASQLDDGPVLVVGLSHSGADLAHEIAATHPVILSGRAHGQMPFSVDSRRARLGWPVIAAFMWHVATLDTPIGRKMAPHVKTGGGPLLRWRKPELKAAGVELTDARTTGVVDGKPVLADGRVLDVANVVWCTGFVERLRLDQPADRCRRARLAGAVPRRVARAWAVLQRRPLPVRVHVDARPWRRPRCRVRRGPDRGAAGCRGARCERGRGHGLTPEEWCPVPGRVRDASTQAERSTGTPPVR